MLRYVEALFYFTQYPYTVFLPHTTKLQSLIKTLLVRTLLKIIGPTAPSEWGKKNNAKKNKKNSMNQVKECDSQVCNMRMVNLLFAFFFLIGYKAYLMYAYFTIIHNNHTAGR